MTQRLGAVPKVGDAVAFFTYLSFRAEQNRPPAGDSAESRNLLSCTVSVGSGLMVSRFII